MNIPKNKCMKIIVPPISPRVSSTSKNFDFFLTDCKWSTKVFFQGSG